MTEMINVTPPDQNHPGYKFDQRLANYHNAVFDELMDLAEHNDMFCFGVRKINRGLGLDNKLWLPGQFPAYHLKSEINEFHTYFWGGIGSVRMPALYLKYNIDNDSVEFVLDNSIDINTYTIRNILSLFLPEYNNKNEAEFSHLVEGVRFSDSKDIVSINLGSGDVVKITHKFIREAWKRIDSQVRYCYDFEKESVGHFAKIKPLDRDMFLMFVDKIFTHYDKKD